MNDPVLKNKNIEDVVLFVPMVCDHCRKKKTTLFFVPKAADSTEYLCLQCCQARIVTCSRRGCNNDATLYCDTCGCNRCDKHMNHSCYRRKVTGRLALKGEANGAPT